MEMHSKWDENRFVVMCHRDSGSSKGQFVTLCELDGDNVCSLLLLLKWQAVHKVYSSVHKVAHGRGATYVGSG